MPLNQAARYKGIKGGRGSGKSHNRAEQLIKRCIKQKTDWVCLREVQKTLDQSVKKLLEAKIEKLGVQHLFDIQANKIKTPNGGVIVFNGMQDHTADSIKSLEGFDGAWFEEAQTMSDRSLMLLRPTIRKEESELWFTWNPENETDAIDRFFNDPPPGTILVEANYYDNPWFPDVLKAEMEWDKAHDYDKYLHVWEGGYNVNSNAKVFKNYRVEEFEAVDGDIFRLGADWGFSVDPSVLVRCFIRGNALYVDYEAYMIGCEIVNLPELFMSVPDSEKWPITADSARPETISHMQKNGFPRIRPAIKGARSLEEGVNFLQSFEIIVHPRCKHTIDELNNYKYKVDPLTSDVLPMLEDKNNHVIDALRYACEGARRAVKENKPTVYVPPKSYGGNSAWMGR